MIPDAAQPVGLGNVAAGVKWRFLDAVAGVPLALSTYPKVELRSFGGEPHAGNRPVEVFLPVEAARSFGRLDVNAEVG